MIKISEINFSYDGDEVDVYGCHFTADGDYDRIEDFFDIDMSDIAKVYDNEEILNCFTKSKECAILGVQAGALPDNITPEKHIRHEIIDLKCKLKRCMNGLESINLNRQIARLENELIRMGRSDFHDTKR